jgi:hypothetical protein
MESRRNDGLEESVFILSEGAQAPEIHGSAS